MIVGGRDRSLDGLGRDRVDPRTARRRGGRRRRLRALATYAGLAILFFFFFFFFLTIFLQQVVGHSALRSGLARFP